MDATKIPSRLENPVDYILIQIADWASSHLYRLDATPNQITVLSAVATYISIHHLIHDKIVGFVVWFWLAYIMDCIDGYYARRYNMTSNLGDYLDHVTDLVGFIALIVVVCLKYHRLMTLPVAILFIGFTVLMMMEVGCQEKWMSRNVPHQNSIKILENICPSGEKGLEGVMKKLSYFSSGTYNLFLMLLVVYLFYQNQKGR